MGNPAFTNDPRAAAYLAEQYRQLHYKNLFAAENPYNKQDARSEAFKRMLEAKQRGEI